MNKKLYRIPKDKMLAGVCTGLAKYFDIDLSVMRLIWVLGALFVNAAVIVAYIVCAFIIPEEPEFEEVN